MQKVLPCLTVLSIDSPASADTIIGATDPRGRLITQGPKKRIAVRVAQVLLAAASGAPAIWGAIVSHIPSVNAASHMFVSQVLKPNPPPGAPAWALFLLSGPTVFLLLWMHLFRGCCSRRKESEGATMPGAFPGMMVMPVSGGGKKKGKEKSRGKYAAQDVQVNLIVDPSMFGAAADEGSEEEDENDGGDDVRQQKAPRKRRARRNHVLAMKQEEAWRVARRRLRWNTVVDGAGVVIWGAVFVWVITKGKCISKSVSGGTGWYVFSPAYFSG